MVGLKNNKMKGFSLVEHMVATLVVSVGLLGHMAVQTNGLQTQQTTLQRTQLVIAVQTLAEKMKLNSIAALNGNYTVGQDAANAVSLASIGNYSSSQCLSGCNPDVLATADINVFYDDLIAIFEPDQDNDVLVRIFPIAAAANGIVNEFNIIVTWSELNAFDYNSSINNNVDPTSLQTYAYSFVPE